MNKNLILIVGSDYDEECVMCGSRDHELVKATPTNPFDGTSCIDLKCKSCGNLTYHFTEGFVESELVSRDQLKPCPFCKDDGSPWLPAPGKAVTCSKCGAEGPLTNPDAPGWTITMVVDLWNSRT